MKRKLLLLSICLVYGFGSLYARELSPQARKLKSFLDSNYGKTVISGQMDLTWNDRTDMADRVYKDTGTYPVLMGYDLMNRSPAMWDGQKQVDEAIAWYKGTYNYNPNYKGHKGGIVAFCWHWRTGQKNEFYTKSTDVRIPMKDGKLDTESAVFLGLKKQMDLIAFDLKRLKDEGVPVLWRPMHEASGGWFWWGASGEAAYKALYIYMFDYFTNEKKLDNLLWVWNGQNKNWYPGDEYVDIVGEDIYAPHHGSQKGKFTQVESYSQTKKIVALSECGRIPEIDASVKDGAMWSWFMVWNDSTTDPKKDFGKDDFWSGEVVNPLEFRKKVYSHEKVMTLDEFPGL